MSHTLKQFLDKINAQNNVWLYYQDVKCTDTKNTVSTFYGDCITGISENEKFQKYFNIACIFESGFFVAYIDLVD